MPATNSCFESNILRALTCFPFSVQFQVERQTAEMVEKDSALESLQARLAQYSVARCAVCPPEGCLHAQCSLFHADDGVV